MIEHERTTSPLALSVPKSGKAEQAAVLHRDGVRLLRLGADFLPLIKTVGRDEAPARRERGPERRFLSHRLGLGVNEAVANLGVLVPERHQTPPEHVEGVLLGLAIQPAFPI